jgi:hypothetical protein
MRDTFSVLAPFTPMPGITLGCVTASSQLIEQSLYLF